MAGASSSIGGWGTVAGWLCGAAAALLAAGCSSSDQETDATEPPPPLPATCDEPPVPPDLRTSTVVGTGTPASCNEAALRAALVQGGNVTFDCGGAATTIAVTSELVIAEDVVLDGGGVVTLDGGGATRLLTTAARVALVVKGMTFANAVGTPSQEDGLGRGAAILVGWLGALYVADSTFTDNAADPGDVEGGGAIYQSNGGSLVVVRSTFERNRGIAGGAVDNMLSPMTIVDSTFVDNESTEGGGAVYDDGASADPDDGVGGTISICGCRFEGNRTVGAGGAVYLYAYPPDSFVINRSSFVGNQVLRPSDGSALGGALRTGNATLQLANSLFVGNHADVQGGGYWTDGNVPVYIDSCTFFDNDAGVVGEDGGYGGAISGTNLVLTNLTLVGNHAVFSGGAISNSGRFLLRNSILANNSSTNPWDQAFSCEGPMAGDHNIQWPAPASDADAPCTAGILMVDPRLGDLSDDGGPTSTIPLLAGSPAIDAGDACSPTDQRGLPRVGACDLGAFEVQ
jgi:hypothetical protein